MKKWVRKRDSGQWIVLSGIVLAIGLVILLSLLNQAMSAGYRVSLAETDFPSRKISDIYEGTWRVARLVRDNVDGNETLFNDNMSYFAENISKIHAAHGYLVKINVTSSSDNTANLTLYFYDGDINFTLSPRRIPL